MSKGTKFIRKTFELHDFLREGRVHKCYSSRSRHVGDWISCEDFALGNLRAEREIRENSFHSGRAPYEDVFIRDSVVYPLSIHGLSAVFRCLSAVYLLFNRR